MNPILRFTLATREARRVGAYAVSPMRRIAGMLRVVGGKP